jgi:protein involved in polysaccharide export with SLBB domain
LLVIAVWHEELKFLSYFLKGGAALILLTAVSPGLVAKQQTPAPTGESVSPAPYRLGAGDVIDVKFTYNSELDARVTVRPDGAISLAMVGDIPVQGLSPAELGKEITTRFSEFRTHSEAVVIVTEFAGQRVYVGGEVNGPGLLALRGTLTGIQALLNAGGPKVSARLDNVILLRYEGKNTAEVRKINMKQIMKGKAPDVTLRPYDVIYVPKSRIAQAGLFVEQYINQMVPRSLVFPYTLNNRVSIITGPTP